MNFQYFDLIQFGLVILSLWALWKVKNKFLRFGPLVVLVLAFIFTPVNMTGKNATMKFSTVPTVPDKVVVEKQDFEQKQKENREKLKQQSKEKLNETID